MPAMAIFLRDLENWVSKRLQTPPTVPRCCRADNVWGYTVDSLTDRIGLPSVIPLGWI